MDCARSAPKTTPFERALQDIDLPPLQKKILMERYNALLIAMDFKTFRISLFYHTSRCIITIGSLIVPALLSIQYTNGTSTNLGIYWTAWVLSLLVTVCNGLMTLLKVDKNYYHLHTVREQLVSDGWQYLELTGKYSGFHTPHHHATHENQFVFFTHSVEKIRMQQIQEEYDKVSDGNHGGSAGPHRNDSDKAAARIVPVSLLPPTPQQGELENIPEAVKLAMETLSQTPLEDGGVKTAVAEEKKDKKNNTYGSARTVSMSRSM